MMSENVELFKEKVQESLRRQIIAINTLSKEVCISSIMAMHSYLKAQEGWCRCYERGGRDLDIIHMYKI